MKNTDATLQTQTGKKAGTVTLPVHVFGKKINSRILSEAVVAMERNRRVPTSHAKDRSEKRGGGRKPWRQKGTGRARHGSIRSPIWTGGGVTHGPLKTRGTKKKVNQKVKNASLAMALSGKRADGEIFFVDELAFNAPRTKDAIAMLKNVLGKKYGTGSVLIVGDEVTDELAKSVGNVPRVSLQRSASLSVYDVLAHSFIIMTKESIDTLSNRLS